MDPLPMEVMILCDFHSILALFPLASNCNAVILLLLPSYFLNNAILYRLIHNVHIICYSY